MNYKDTFKGKANEYVGAIQVGAAPVDGTSEVQNVAITADAVTGGEISFTWDGNTSSAITWATLNGAAAGAQTAIKNALEAMPRFYGTVTVVRSGTTPNFTFAVTFGGDYEKLNVPMIGVNNDLTGTNTAIAVTAATPGVTGTHRGAPKGTLIYDTANDKIYVQTGTETAPAWVELTQAS